MTSMDGKGSHTSWDVDCGAGACADAGGAAGGVGGVSSRSSGRNMTIKRRQHRRRPRRCISPSTLSLLSSSPSSLLRVVVLMATLMIYLCSSISLPCHASAESGARTSVAFENENQQDRQLPDEQHAHDIDDHQQNDQYDNEEEEQQEGSDEKSNKKNPVHLVSKMDELHTIVDTVRSEHFPSSIIYVFLAYSNDCEQSMQVLWRFHFAVREMMKLNATLSSSIILQPVFIQFLVNDDTVQLLDSYDIKTVPSLFFVKEQQHRQDQQDQAPDTGADAGNNDDDGNRQREDVMTSFYAIEYRGITTTVPQLVDGICHYLVRLRHSYISEKTNTVNNRTYTDSLTVHVESLQALQDNILKPHSGSGNMNVLRRSPPIPLDPNFSESEDEWIRYMMDDNGVGLNDDVAASSSTTIDGDVSDFYVICQCRCCHGQYNPSNDYEVPENFGDDDDEQLVYRSSTSSLNLTLYNEFDLVAHALSGRRDVLFCVLTENCASGTGDADATNIDGSISSFTVSPENDWIPEKKHSLLPSDRKNFSDWVNPILRPDVLWLDRRMTAPILFQQQYRTHAVLFVDFHDRSNMHVMRDAVRVLRSECQEQRKDYEHDSMVCLVVPSTDIRMLKTFGIDIWSPMDRYATTIISAEKLQHSQSDVEYKKDTGRFLSPAPPPVLPTLLLTNRRPNSSGIERYYLDLPITTERVSQFMTDFRSGKAIPEMKSRKRRTKTTTDESSRNDHGIYVLTGETLSPFLEEHRHDHVLLQLYVPTCGHCKRFNVVWNGLGDVVEYLGWKDLLVLARMDITSNDFFVPGVSPSWLPDMFYFGRGVTERPIHYDDTEMGREAPLGAFSDPLDVIDWWLDQAGEAVDHASLLGDLLGKDSVQD